MSRVKITTTLDEELLLKAKDVVAVQDLDGVNAVIEKALRLYFANCTVEVWEKVLSGGWVKKLVIRPDRITFESIKSRKVNKRVNPNSYSSDTLESKGWKRVWKMKSVS